MWIRNYSTEFDVLPQSLQFAHTDTKIFFLLHWYTKNKLESKTIKAYFLYINNWIYLIEML